jgi:hypothetical protein
MSSYDGTSNPVKSYPAATYQRLGLDVYPNPYFDPSSWYTPPTVKEMFRWCLYLYLTNSTIGPVVRKKASYVVTDLIYEAVDPATKEVYQDILEKVLKIRRFEILMLLDYEVYGNAFASILFPFDRYLICPRCNNENLMKGMEWSYDGKRFQGRCKKCNSFSIMESKDVYVRNRKRIRMQRWNPMYIEPRRGPTGKTEYVLRLPKWLRQRIMDTKINRIYVEDTPKVFLEAVRDDKNVLLDSENIFHMKYDSISMEDDTLGIPPILNVMKDVWLLQTYKKGQESIALDHILPLTLLSPMPAQGGMSPHMDTDLGSWRSRMSQIISQWRRDPNAMFPVPFPVNVSQIRGDAAALSLYHDIDLTRQGIAGGMDVPADFIYGNITYSGGNVNMRVLENQLIAKISSCEDMLNEWAVPKIRAFYRLGACTVKHAKFKMADDVQQKQIALNLRQSNTISDKTVLDQLDFDYDKEQKQKRVEAEERLSEMRRTQIAQAEIEAQVSIIRAKAQAQAQVIQQRVMAEAGTTPEQAQADQQQAQMAQQQGEMDQQRAQMDQEKQQKGRQPKAQQPAPAEPVDFQTNQVVTDLRAEHFLKSVPPNEVDHQLNVLNQSNPVLAGTIRAKLKMMQDNQIAQPLPDQKPPRRSPATAVI